MASIAQHISALRILIKKYEDDSIYTDEALYHLLNQTNATLTKRLASKFNKLSDWNFEYFCLELEETTLDICGDCIPVERCKAYRTKVKIPKPLTVRNRDILDVRQLNLKSIPRAGRDPSVNIFDPVKSQMFTYGIYNQRIHVFGGKLKTIQVGGVWEDVTQWEGIEICDSETLEVTCLDIHNMQFPLDAQYSFMAYEMVLKVLGLSLQIPEVSDPIVNKNHPV